MSDKIELEGTKVELNKLKTYINTVSEHIRYVQELCDAMGISELGKQHDISKFSPEEMSICKYADGTRSPHDIAREKLGYSPSWVYHKAKNQHHWEFWIDCHSATPNGDGTFTIICKCVKMPYERVIEMFCDFVGAGKAYNKEKWTHHTPLDYYNKKCLNQRAMHKQSQELLEKLLTKLDEVGYDKFITWYNKNKEELMKEYDK